MTTERGGGDKEGAMISPMKVGEGEESECDTTILRCGSLFSIPPFSSSTDVLFGRKKEAAKYKRKKCNTIRDSRRSGLRLLYFTSLHSVASTEGRRSEKQIKK